MLGLFFWFTARQNFGGVLADFLECPFYFGLLLPLTLQLFRPVTRKDTSCVPHLSLVSQEC